MAKVIIFSREFPKGHPKQGQPTYFVEQFFNSIFSKNNLMDYPKGLEIDESILGIKKHTIRDGNRFKVGDKFSPRVWSDKPYRSKQIILCGDVEIKEVYNIDILTNNEIHINGVYFATFGSSNCQLLAKNDGLDMIDFTNWFSKRPFKGQIIYWHLGNVWSLYS